MKARHELFMLDIYLSHVCVCTHSKMLQFHLQVSVYTWTINQQLNITNVTRFTMDVRTEITRVLNYIIVSKQFFSIHYCVNIYIVISMLILRMNACVFCTGTYHMYIYLLRHFLQGKEVFFTFLNTFLSQIKYVIRKNNFMRTSISSRSIVKACFKGTGPNLTRKR